MERRGGDLVPVTGLGEKFCLLMGGMVGTVGMESGEWGYQYWAYQYEALTKGEGGLAYPGTAVSTLNTKQPYSYVLSPSRISLLRLLCSSTETFITLHTIIPKYRRFHSLKANIHYVVRFRVIRLIHQGRFRVSGSRQSHESLELVFPPSIQGVQSFFD